MRPVFWVVCLLLLLAWPSLASDGEATPELEVRATSPDALFEYEEGTGVVSDPAGVVVTYGDAELTATRVRFNRETAEVEAEGRVRLQRANQLWTGERLRYNFALEQMDASVFKTGMPPYFAAGQGLASNLTNDTHTATNAFVTTDDTAAPAYRIRARHLKVVPGKMVEVKRATLYLGKVPVMYLPVYRRYLHRHPNNFVFTPGFRTLHGPYLLGTYNWSIQTNLSAAIHLDYRQRRGVGGGPDLLYDVGRLGSGEIQTYAIHDEDPQTDPAGLPIREDRYRLRLYHSADLRENLSAKLAVRAQSDAQVVRDFFETEFRKDTQPRSFLEVNQLWPNFSLNLLAQPQVNDFFQTVERLPDIKLTGLRQQLGISPFYYESESSLGYFRFRSGLPSGTNYAAYRGDSFHQLVLPRTFFGWLNVTPRAGGRFTRYGELDETAVPTEEQQRFVFNTGAEVSTKASRVWRGAHSKLFEVNQLRHILEPSLNYVYVPTPSIEPQRLPQFDHELYSLHLQPIDFPDYNSIDSIDSQNVLRVGLRNRLQTKRRDQIDNLLNMAVFADWRIKPRPDQDTFTDLYSAFELKPRSWMAISSETRYDLNDRSLRMANSGFTLTPNNTWSWKLGHRYLRSDPLLGPDAGNNLFQSSIYLRLNENWALRFVHHFEARDGTLEEQYYTVYRDLRSWTAALTLRWRDNRRGRDDFTVAVTLSLKAFPRFGLGRDRDEPSLLLGN